jgi:hypothetical protein
MKKVLALGAALGLSGCLGAKPSAVELTRTETLASRTEAYIHCVNDKAGSLSFSVEPVRAVVRGAMAACSAEETAMSAAARAEYHNAPHSSRFVTSVKEKVRSRATQRIAELKRKLLQEAAQSKELNEPPVPMAPPDPKPGRPGFDI